MAKTIKFNLICDEKPVRTIEDLQNNFSIEDILDYYNNQLLHRWLRVRGYDSELEAVTAIDSTDPMDIVKELIRIFSVGADEDKVEESIYMLKFLNERKEHCAVYEEEQHKTSRIIEDYEAGYRRLVDGIVHDPKNVALIKASIAEIVSNYSWAFELNHRALFQTLSDVSPLAIMCLLMNEKSRKYYLPIEIENDDGSVSLDTDNNFDKKTMFSKIRTNISRSDFLNDMADELISFAGVTDGYWKDLAPKGKKYMIISMGDGDYVRSAGHSGGDLSHADITSKFVIVDGIDYKSNSSSRTLLYMEV